MLIGPDSPLRKLPVNLDKRQALYLGGIRHSIEIIDLCYRQLLGVLQHIGSAHDRGEDRDPDAEAAAVMTAWSMVDAANRLRVLLGTMPRLKKSEPKHQVLLRRLATFEELRNPIQHLNTELTKRSQSHDATLVWGALAWVHLDDDLKGCRTLVLIPGTAHHGTRVGLVNPGGKEFRHQIDQVELEAYDSRVSLSGLFSAVAAWTADFRDVMDSQFDGAHHSGSGLLIAAHITYQDPPPGTDFTST